MKFNFAGDNKHFSVRKTRVISIFVAKELENFLELELAEYNAVDIVKAKEKKNIFSIVITVK